MAMTKLCYVALAILLILVGIEVNLRKDWLLSPDWPQWFEAQQWIPTPFQWALFPAYVLFLYVGSFLVPGYYHKGAVLRDGSYVEYKINGFRLLVLTFASAFAATHFGLFRATILYDNFRAIFVSINVYSFLLSVVLFVKGQLKKNKSQGEGIGGLKGFWLGEELMPWIAGVPIKFFWLRPSMMLWGLINLSLLAKHFEINGFVSTPMILYQIFSAIYIADYFWHEEFMTSTWDIIAENFGFMLVWGDEVFIPFVFSCQAWYLLTDNSHFEIYQIVLVTLVFLTGFSIFRGSNSQKHHFKHNPKTLIWGKEPEAINGRLLVSGFWGLARHINYTGDIILGIGFSLPCLFQSVLPWVYPIYLTLLLVHREQRDHHKCKEKYKEVWDQYCKRVPYRMIPFVY